MIHDGYRGGPTALRRHRIRVRPAHPLLCDLRPRPPELVRVTAWPAGSRYRGRARRRCRTGGAGGRSQGEVLAIDNAPNMLRALSVDHPDLPQLSTRIMDAHRLDLPDASFDVVTCGFILHFLDDPARAIAEAHRVLRPGGLLAFSGPPTNQAPKPAGSKALVDAVRALDLPDEPGVAYLAGGAHDPGRTGSPRQRARLAAQGRAHEAVLDAGQKGSRLTSGLIDIAIIIPV
ncbi:class I SAM-dependent methyltransferase [Nonomuraea sp. NPDC049784]|uniref:class I SAM-dependent methyltransferase n=1 Tax=Nonomuraea sp. NPDC049784 TaxID=3154361 RepID=UPI0033EC1602